MKKYISVLNACTLFRSINEEDIPALLGCLGARVEVFGKKNTVMAEDSRAEEIGIVLSGAVQLEMTDFRGNRSIIGVINRGGVFAEAFACSEIEGMPVAVVATEVSEIMFIDASHILHTCKNNCFFHNRLIFNLMKDVATETVMYHRKTEIISKRSTREKLLTYLSIVSREKGAKAFSVPFDRQELADFLQVDRSGLSSEIGKLKKEGIIDSRKNYFELL